MEKRIFEHYKNRLINEGGRKENIRFNVIQYLCSFPRINPVEMAAALTTEGYSVLYDDTSITSAENEANKRRVDKMLNKRA